MSLLIDGAEVPEQVGKGPNANASSSAFHRVAGSGLSQNIANLQASSQDSHNRNSVNQRNSNSPPIPRPTLSTLSHEANVSMHKPGVMATVPGITNSRVPLKSISPTHSGEGPTEDEVDSPTPSSTASEPTDQFFPSPKSNQRSTNHRIKDPIHSKSSHLKNFGIEDGRTTDEEDMEGDRDDAFAWPTHSSYDEQRQLLGTEEESSDRASSEDELLGEDEDTEGSSLNKKDFSNQQSRSVWAITKEQLNYYTTQFFNMQSNPGGVIPGTLAKEFFEKSRLPISELRIIWQLSDVSKDGCLSLDEFLTAMHLVVLRRNDIALPESLPNCLRPEFLRKKLEPRIRGLMAGQRKPNDTIDGPNCTMEKTENSDKQISAITSAAARMEVGNDSLSGESSFKRQSTEAALAAEDTASLASLVSSPGAGDRPKPVNFDFMRPDVRRDPHIVQPLPLRISSPPESPTQGVGRSETSDLDVSEEENAKRAEQMRRPSGHQAKGEVVYEQFPVSDSDDDEDSANSMPIRQQAGSNPNGSKAGPISLPPSKPNISSATVSHHPLGLAKKEGDPPPIPPPRSGPGSGHNRSSSLDYNIGNSRLMMAQGNSSYQRQMINTQAYNSSKQQHQPFRSVGGPPIPPRYPSQNSPDSCTPTQSSPTSTPPRSPSPRASTTGAHHMGVFAFQNKTVGQKSGCKGAMSELSRDTKLLQISIQQFKERNSVVARTINELHQEVSDTLEERIALEYQLEQLKSFGE